MPCQLCNRGLSPQSLSRDQGHISEGPDIKAPEELLALGTFSLPHCKALIQTKVSAPHRRGLGGEAGCTQLRVLTESGSCSLILGHLER